MSQSRIEWTGPVWNPTVGCSPQSAGCLHCYAAAVSHRELCPEHVGLTRLVKRRNARGKLVNLPVFNGTVRELPDRLTLPLTWPTPRLCFVDSMSDLFHDRVRFEYIAAVFGVMAACPHITFQILTKNPARAAAFFVWLRSQDEGPVEVCLQATAGMVYTDKLQSDRWDAALERTGLDRSDRAFDPPWPLPNVWLGFSAEDGPNFRRREAESRAWETAVRWGSLEPLIGPIESHQIARSGLDWVVCGGESGPGARPCRVSWLREIVHGCASAELEPRRAAIPVFVKQLGAHVVMPAGHRTLFADAKGGKKAEWKAQGLADLCIEQWPKALEDAA